MTIDKLSDGQWFGLFTEEEIVYLAALIGHTSATQRREIIRAGIEQHTGTRIFKLVNPKAGRNLNSDPAGDLHSQVWDVLARPVQPQSSEGNE